MSSNKSAKLLSCLALLKSGIAYDKERVPTDLHPLLERYEGRVHQSSECVYCPKCKVEVMIALYDENYSSECEWMEYFTETNAYFDDVSELRLYCKSCKVVSLSCPWCSDAQRDWDKVKHGKVVLAKYVGFVQDGSESLPKRPNRRPNKDDLKDDDERSESDYDNAPPLPKDEFDGTEQSPEFEYIDYYYGNENRLWATDEDMNTGGCGGCPVFWRCEFCDFVLRMNDK